MRYRSVFILTIIAAVAGGFSCSGSASENKGNRTTANAAANEAPVPPSPTATPTPEDQEPYVRKLVNDFSAALTKGDVETLDGMISDGFILITDGGQITTKADWITMIKSGDLKFDKVQFEELSTRLYGNTAVAVAHMLVTNRYNGKTQSLEDQATLVVAKENNGWRFVNWQMTRIAAAPASGNSKNTNSSNTNSSANSTTKGPANGRF